MNGPQQSSPASDSQTWQHNPAADAVPGPAPRAAQPAAISAYDPRYKSPLVASFLSSFPGLGQIYVGYYRVGFTHAAIIASLITLLASDMDDLFRPLLAIFMVFFWLYNVIDAGRRAALYNHALRDGAVFDVPTTPSFAGGNGSLAGGVALIVIGILFLMNTALDYSMEWVADWWPMGPILFGAYLVYQAVTEKKNARA